MVEVVVKLPKLESQLEKQVVKGIEVLARAEVARAVMLERLNKMLSKSELTEEECIKLGRKVNRAMRKRLEEKGLL